RSEWRNLILSGNAKEISPFRSQAPSSRDDKCSLPFWYKLPPVEMTSAACLSNRSGESSCLSNNAKYIDVPYTRLIDPGYCAIVLSEVRSVNPSQSACATRMRSK